MSKKDLPLIFVFVILLISWGEIDKRFIKPNFFPTPPAATPDPAVESGSPSGTTPSASPGGAAPGGSPAVPVPGPDAGTSGSPPEPPPELAPAVPRAEEVLHVISNETLQVTFSSYGAGLVDAVLPHIPLHNEPDSEPVRFDVRDNPSLEYEELPGFDVHADFATTPIQGGVAYTATSPLGISLRREVVINPDNYTLNIRDTFSNTTTNLVTLPEHSLQVGSIRRYGKPSRTLPITVGADASVTGGEGVKHYAKDLYKTSRKSGSGEATVEVRNPVTWLNVKNRFFTKLLTFVEGQTPLPNEARIYGRSNSPGAKDANIDFVESQVRFGAIPLRPQESRTREMIYFVGPSKLSALDRIPGNQEKMVDYQFWKLFRFVEPISAFLLKILNLIQAIPPHSYGLAIILLTVVVRGLFWPLTHKSTENMKKMQVLQPKLQEIKAKYKNNPQKQNMAMQALFKEHGINPLNMGCLPMFLQIPVFIGLYGLLRTAVELRFADFLWIRDLSEPEGMLAGKIPIAGDLNILPLAMGLSMFLMQKKTPTTMDPAQQKVMTIFMPIFLTVVCYHMPAGLLVYWTTSNLMSLYQMIHKNKRQKAAEAAEAAAVAAAPVQESKGGAASRKKNRK